MSGLFKSSGAIGQAFSRARQGSQPLTGIEPPGPGVDRSQAGIDTGEGRRRGGRRGSRTGGGRTSLGARTVMSSTY